MTTSTPKVEDPATDGPSVAPEPATEAVPAAPVPNAESSVTPVQPPPPADVAGPPAPAEAPAPAASAAGPAPASDAVPVPDAIPSLPGKDVSFAWEATSGSRSYEVEFTKKLGSEFKTFDGSVKRTKEPSFSGRVGVGVYHIRIRSVDRRGVPGVWSDPIDLTIPMPLVQPMMPEANMSVPGKGAEKSKVSFLWAKSPDAASYQIAVSGDNGQLLLEQKTGDSKFSAELPVAKSYSWTVRGISADGDVSDASTPRIFRLLGAHLKKPELEYKEEAQNRIVTWKPVEHAESYDVELKFRQGKVWEQVALKNGEIGTSYLIQKDLKPGNYRVFVQAKSSWWQDSKRGVTKFKVAEPKVEAPKPPPKKKKKKAKLDPAQELAKDLASKWLRIAGKYTPTYWIHGAANDDNAGVAFDILLFSRFRLDTEAWLFERNVSLALTYDKWATTLFTGGLAGSGVEDYQPELVLRSQEIAFKGKYYIPIMFSNLSIQSGIRRSSVIFFYKDTPSTIALVNSAITSLTVGSGISIPLGQLGELHGLAELGYPFPGSGLTINKATDYRLNSEYIQYLGSPDFSLSLYYQYDYRQYVYDLSVQAVSGHVIDTMHAVGVGLELRL
ncbi:MAG: hypothetical protein NTY08_15435 [Proteobacteria bacterium]|nr:hypothetical protein [Pseudomonadota bacterium]